MRPTQLINPNLPLAYELGFICVDLPGHLNPMTTLARHLQDRNHEVIFLYSLGAAGLPFVRSPEKGHVGGSRPQVSKMQGEDALKFGLGTVLAQTETIRYYNHCPPSYKQPESMP